MEFVPNSDLIAEKLPELKSFSDEILHVQCVDASSEEGRSVARELEKILKKYRSLTGMGRGLAAPQIGIPQRVFITYIGEQLQTYINPNIESSSSETNRYRELCMSANGQWGDIERPASITLSWMDTDGNKHTETFDGFIARLLQHEYDHLEGIVCLEKALPGTIGPVSSNPLNEELR